MSDQVQANDIPAAEPPKAPPAADCGAETPRDLSGRDRLVRNVVFSWGGHLVFIVSGFIMPRMIDQQLGQELLGVWDFAWSLVNYFRVVQLGVVSSVNRYVARYRAASDIHGVNCVASSATFLLVIGGSVICVLAIGVSRYLPELFGARLGTNVRDAQVVILLLGMSMAIRVSVRAFGGILTGCHFWGLHNLNTSGWHAVTVAGMIVALILGGGIRALAFATFLGQFLADLRLVILAHRACDGLQVRLSLVRWRTIKNLYVFGGKTLLPGLAQLLLNQTTSILIVEYLGQAALALYSRPRSLMHHVDVLVRKMAMTLIPTTSSLESASRTQEIRELVIKSARYSFYLALPIVLLLVVFGGVILQLWMGPDYANGLIPAVLAMGHLAVMIQLPALNILTGLNAHGRPGLARLVASLCSVGLSFIVLEYSDLGLLGMAMAATIPLTVVNLVDIPAVICRRVQLSLTEYFKAITVGPVLHVLPFAACLIGARLVLSHSPLLGLLLGAAVGGSLLLIVYWRYVLPHSIRRKATLLLRRWEKAPA